MMRLLRWFLLVACVAGVAVAWTQFAPLGVGGRVAYVIITGSSMEPLLHDGDLALVRPQPSYTVGDVVAYRSDDLGQVVLHRIVSTDGNTYRLQGDNNDFIDPEQPHRSQLVGTQWVHVDGGGRPVELVKSPRNAAVVVAVLTLLAILAGGGRGGLRRRSAARTADVGAPVVQPAAVDDVPPVVDLPPVPADTAAASTPPGVQRAMLPAPPLTLLATLAVLTVVLLAITAFAFIQPVTRTVEQTVAYRQTGRISYSAQTPDTPAYDGVLSTGDPVYLKILNEVDVAVDYAFDTDGGTQLAGTSQLEVIVSDDTGWSRTLVLDGPTRFDGTTAHTVAALDISAIQQLTRRVQRATGIDKELYAVAVVSTVELDGTVAGEPVDERFSARADFELTDLQLRYLPQARNTAAPDGADTGTVTLTHAEPNRLGVGALNAEVPALRRATGITAALALASLLATAWVAWRRLRGDENQQIQLRHSRLLVAVSAPPAGVPVDVQSFDSLVKVAQRAERLILQLQEPGHVRYFVEDAGLLYRCTVAALEQHREGLDVPATDVPAGDISITRREPVAARAGAFKG